MTKPPVKPPVEPPCKPPVEPSMKPPIELHAKLEVKPPVKPLVKPPVKPPIEPHVKPSVKLPIPLPKKMVAIEGVVYYKSCKCRGTDKLMDAPHLLDDVVKLQCTDKKFSLVEETKANKKGHSFFKPEKLTTSIAHKCKVYLVSSPLYKCSIPMKLNGGVVGTIFKRSVTTIDKKKPLVHYTVGPFAKKLCYYY